MRYELPVAAVLLALSLSPARVAAADTHPYVEAIRRLNEDHARKPGKVTEAELSKRFPAAAVKALDALLAAKVSPEKHAALEACATAALDLDRIAEFDRIRECLTKEAPDRAARVGAALSRPRFILHGTDGLDGAYLEKFAPVFEGILTAYDEVFGFAEFSKVPGKKIRVHVHLVEKITRPPHFAIEHPYHSQIDFPVVDAEKLTSPTQDGKFLFYGLCHELGHLIAMWGDMKNEEDHHAWAHYTGVAIVEHLSAAKDPPEWMKELRDVKWRSVELERKEAEGRKPSTADKPGAMALFLALHDRVGPKAIGAAINALDAEDKRLRIGRVRYYSFAQLKRSLLTVLKDKQTAAAVQEIIP